MFQPLTLAVVGTIRLYQRIGTVYAWTRCWYTFDRTTERAPDLPYVVVLTEIPAADGARVIGVLRGAEQQLRIGAPVRGYIDAPSAKTKGYAAIRWVLGAP